MIEMDTNIDRVPIHVDTSRKIIHVDMDAFYASIEERENSKLRKKPLVIARDPRQTGGKGVVATANYLARQSGVHSAMSAQKALELCPEAVLKHQISLYIVQFPIKFMKSLENIQKKLNQLRLMKLIWM